MMLKNLRPSSKLHSEFLVPVWCHKSYETPFKITFWVCSPNMMPQVVWDALQDYLLNLLSPHDASFLMRRFSRLPFEFAVSIWCHKLYEALLKTLFWVCWAHMKTQIVWDTLLNYFLSLLTPYDARNYMRCSSKLPFEFVVPFDATTFMRFTSELPSEFEPPKWHQNLYILLF